MRIGSERQIPFILEATLENGMKIDVPQFVETGAIVEVDSETGKYIDRVQE